MGERAKFSVRLDEPIARLVKQVAVDERRTPANVLRNALADWARRYEVEVEDQCRTR